MSGYDPSTFDYQHLMNWLQGDKHTNGRWPRSDLWVFSVSHFVDYIMLSPQLHHLSEFEIVQIASVLRDLSYRSTHVNVADFASQVWKCVQNRIGKDNGLYV